MHKEAIERVQVDVADLYEDKVCLHVERGWDFVGHWCRWSVCSGQDSKNEERRGECLW